MKKYRYGALCFIFLVMVSGCTLFPGVPNAQRHVNTEYGFSIDLPRHWEKREGLDGSVIAAVTPLEGADDAWQENVNVTVGPMPEDVTLDKYLRLNMGLMQQFLPNFEQRGYGDITIGRRKGQWVDYTYDIETYRLQTLMYLVEKDGMVYIITFTGEAKSFPAYVKTFRRIVKSFRFLKGK